jgi:hypothetical protein
MRVIFTSFVEEITGKYNNYKTRSKILYELDCFLPRRSDYVIVNDFEYEVTSVDIYLGKEYAEVNIHPINRTYDAYGQLYRTTCHHKDHVKLGLV